MTVDVKQMVGNYAESLYYGARDSSGYLVGATATAPTAGNQDGSAMARLRGLQDFPFEPVDPDRPTQRGDGGALARFLNKPTELPEANMTFGAGDYDFDALAQTLSVIATFGGGEFIGRQPEDPTFEDLILLAIAQAKDLSGNSLWEARFIHTVNVYSKGRNSFNDSSLPTYNYSMVANYSSYYPWGLAFVAGTDGDDKFVYTDFTWPYRPILQRWTGDAAETTFNLAQNIAEDSADNIIAYVNGTAATWVTGAPGAGEFGITEGATDTLVFGTAPASAGKVVSLYGWS